MKKFFTLFSLALLTMSAWGANTYVKVNSIDQLVAGQKYILVNEEASVALGEITGTSTNYGSAVDITIADGVIDIDDTDAVELTIGEGNMDEYGNPCWTFNMGGEGERLYIGWASGNSLNIITGLGTLNTQWKADVTDDGVVLTNKADNTRKLQYNAGAPRFACYTSSQKPAVLYVQGVPEDEGIVNLKQANALEDNTEFTFNGNAVVTVCKNGYLFLRDESGYGMIADTDATFENGQVLNTGWNATKISVNNGWVRYTNAAGLSDSGETNADLAAAQVLTTFPDENMINAFVVIENTVISSGGGSFPGLPVRNYTLPDNSTITKTETLWGMDGDAGDDPFNVYGIICKVGNKLMIQPVAFEPYVAPPTFLRGDVNDDTNINITDVTLLINYLLSHDATGVNLQAADCNMDDNVNITDVTTLINYLLSHTWE